MANPQFTISVFLREVWRAAALHVQSRPAACTPGVDFPGGELARREGNQYRTVRQASGRQSRPACRSPSGSEFAQQSPIQGAQRRQSSSGSEFAQQSLIQGAQRRQSSGSEFAQQSPIQGAQRRQSSGSSLFVVMRGYTLQILKPSAYSTPH